MFTKKVRFKMSFYEKRMGNSQIPTKETTMVNKFFILLSPLCICAFMIGCSVLFSEQEWSDNYALLDGTKSTSLLAIDGDMETIGHAQARERAKGAGRIAPEVVVTLPEKKVIRKVIIYSDNIKKFNLYVDKGGSALADTDWQLIKEVQSVKKGIAVVPIFHLHPTDKVKLVIIGTTDDAALARQQSASRSTNGTRSSQDNKTGIGGFRRARAAAKIREIEIFGYKTDKDIKDETITKDDRIVEDDPIEEEDTDQFDALLY